MESMESESDSVDFGATFLVAIDGLFIPGNPPLLGIPDPSLGDP